eukprot:13046470-Alexandrium_andersonii.AAC.1
MFRVAKIETRRAPPRMVCAVLAPAAVLYTFFLRSCHFRLNIEQPWDRSEARRAGKEGYSEPCLL